MAGAAPLTAVVATTAARARLVTMRRIISSALSLLPSRGGTPARQDSVAVSRSAAAQAQALARNTRVSLTAGHLAGQAITAAPARQAPTGQPTGAGRYVPWPPPGRTSFRCEPRGWMSGHIKPGPPGGMDQERRQRGTRSLRPSGGSAPARTSSLRLERARASRQLQSASVHGGILLHQAASLLRRDAEDRQPWELIIHQRACCQQMSGLVQVHRVWHLRVLQRGGPRLIPARYGRKLGRHDDSMGHYGFSGG